jgi:hypothetical protein
MAHITHTKDQAAACRKPTTLFFRLKTPRSRVIIKATNSRKEEKKISSLLMKDERKSENSSGQIKAQIWILPTIGGISDEI